MAFDGFVIGANRAESGDRPTLRASSIHASALTPCIAEYRETDRRKAKVEPRDGRPVWLAEGSLQSECAPVSTVPKVHQGRKAANPSDECDSLADE